MSMSKLFNAGKNSMIKYLFSCVIMQRNAAVITVVCILLCLTFNYTFPLHRVSTNWYPDFLNHTHICDGSSSHDNIADRAKKMTINIEDSNRKIKNFNKDVTVDGHVTNTIKYSADKNPLSEDDLRQYEQLVFMKKYPYLDRKELEIKFRPSNGKNARQSVKFEGGPDIAGESGICEPVDEGPNVEIINRGLTGFAIPAKISKATIILDTKQKLYAKADDGFRGVKLTKPDDVLESLQNDIRKYEERKRDKNT